LPRGARRYDEVPGSEPEPEPGTRNPEPDSMKSKYFQVLALEAAIVAALWIFGRLYR
jgi:hypothetical protein